MTARGRKRRKGDYEKEMERMGRSLYTSSSRSLFQKKCLVQRWESQTEVPSLCMDRDEVSAVGRGRN